MFKKAVAIGLAGVAGLWSAEVRAGDGAVCPASPSAISDTAAAIIDAFKNMLPDVVLVQHEQLAAQEACLNAVPSPSQVAQIYLGEVLTASLNGRPADAERWLHAIVEADPATTLPLDVAAEGTKLQLQLRGVRLSPAKPRAPAWITRGYTLLLDGVPSAQRSTDRPALYVVLDDRGGVWGSGILEPDGSLPDPPPLGTGRRPWPKALLIAEGSSAAVAAGLWAVALVDRGRVGHALGVIAEPGGDPGMTAPGLQRLASTTNGLGFAAQGATGVVVGLAALGFAVRW